MSNPTVPANEAFVVTIGVPGGAKSQQHCKRALEVLRRAGYRAGPTSNEAILALAQQVELTEQLKENDPA